MPEQRSTRMIDAVARDRERAAPQQSARAYRGMLLRWTWAQEPAGRPGVLELRAERLGWRWLVSALLTRNARSCPLPLPAGAPERTAWIVEPDLDLYHLDIPGVLSATLAAPNGRDSRCLFARTDLFAALGVAGGRYELASAALIPA